MDASNITVLADGRTDTKGAASYTGYAEKTLACWRSLGIGPRFVKRGRVWYFLRDLDEWLAEGAARSTAEARHMPDTRTAEATEAAKLTAAKAKQTRRERRPPSKRPTTQSETA